MRDPELVALGLIIGCGIAAQWLAWRTRLPSILLLLITGVALGPASALLTQDGKPLVNPDHLFGELLIPFVGVCLALILFEGGLSLQLKELTAITRVFWVLVTAGALITWAVLAVASYGLLPMGWPESILFGAILVVTGPTVILPLLRQIRPSRRIASLLKWEGIFIDPVGAALAVLVLEAVLAGTLQAGPTVARIFGGIALVALIGFTMGVAGALFLATTMRRHWVPDHLQNAAALAVVVLFFSVSNEFYAESGLLTVTVMGVALANQRWVAIRHLVEFKENLRVLLLAILFVLLASRLKFESFQDLGPGSLAFFAVVVLVARPLSVFAASAGSALTWQERAFACWMAPRGVLAAAVASIFAFRMQEAGYPNARYMVPVAFLVIGGTVALYGLSAGWVARQLSLAQLHAQGCVIVGAHRLARELGKVLKAEGFRALLLDTNWRNIATARMQGLDAHYGDAMSEAVFEELDLSGIGYLLALTPNDEVNALAALHFSEALGRDAVFQLPTEYDETDHASRQPARHLRGRTLFSKRATYAFLIDRLTRGAAVKVVVFTEEFTYDEFRKLHGDAALPLMVIRESGQVRVVTADAVPKPQPGQRLVWLTDESAGVEQKEAAIEDS